MNIKTIRQSLALLALGFVTVTAGCNQTPKDAAFFEACYGSNARAAREADFAARHQAGTAARGNGGAMVDVHTLDRALSYNEIRSQYSKATADEFVAQGLDR